MENKAAKMKNAKELNLKSKVGDRIVYGSYLATIIEIRYVKPHNGRSFVTAKIKPDTSELVVLVSYPNLN